MSDHKISVPPRAHTRRILKVAAGAVPFALTLIFLNGCSSPSNSSSGSSGSSGNAASSSGSGGAIQGAGATFPAPIYTKWFAAYTQQTGTNVNYQAVGSGAGYKALKDNTVDFAASDAPLSDEEEKALANPVVHIPTVGGAVVLTYNLPGAPANLHLAGDVIADIFLGNIKTWSDPRITALNPGVSLPGTAITSVHRTDGSGTTYIFTHYLQKVSPNWASKIGAGKSVDWPAGLGGKGSDGVAGVVRRTNGGIGYVELAYAIANKLPFAAVKNHDGNFVTASAETTTAAIGQYVDQLTKDIKTPTVDAPGANSYPICSVTYILIYKSGGKNTAAAAKLWDWAMQPAQQQQAGSLYYASLPEAIVKLNQAALQPLEGAPAAGK